MASVEYSLFRIKFIRTPQSQIFQAQLKTSDIFLIAIGERPSAELRVGYHWHIGNVNRYSATSGYFAVGRTTISTIEKFDTKTGNFIEEELEESPYTHCVYDASMGLVGIAKKTILAPTAKGIANRLEQLFNQCKIVLDSGVTVEIKPIPDPDGFIQAISTAYRITRFTASFGGPNPFDADEYFQKPLSILLSAANGSAGKATVGGVNLNRDVLIEVTRSSAATGNEASARIQKTQRQKPITINLKGDPIKRNYSEEQHNIEEVLADLQTQYQRVRQHENN